VSKFRTNLESWYNAAMDRASGWYKKYTQTLLLMIGLALAVTFNVDSIRVARALWTDKDVRQGMVNAASEYARQHPDSQSANGAAQEGKKVFDAAELKTQMQATANQFNDAATANLLPVGWKAPDVWTRRRQNFLHHPLVSVGHGLGWLGYAYTWQLMLGWFMTAVAISMGAPFWFDTLNKFMVVRGTVKPAEKSGPEGSKDSAAPVQPQAMVNPAGAPAPAPAPAPNADGGQ
jgi:hypothetical protein